MFHPCHCNFPKGKAFCINRFLSYRKVGGIVVKCHPECHPWLLPVGSELSKFKHPLAVTHDSFGRRGGLYVSKPVKVACFVDGDGKEVAVMNLMSPIDIKQNFHKDHQ